MSRNFKIGVFITLAILTTTFTFYFWQIFKTPNIQVDKQTSFALLIPEGGTYEQVLDSLNKHDVITDQISFRFLAKFLKYPEKVKAGRYVLKPNTSNYNAIKKLVSGSQDAVKLTFNNIRLKDDLIRRIGNKFEFGEDAFRKALNDPEVCRKYGLDTLTIVSMFLPNTYEVFWTTGTEKFLDRMHSEYKKYWNEQRLAKAAAIGLTPVQVSVLASIVEEEQARKVDERPKVAGLYINRLHAGMPLQADPTIKFALQDFAIKRILNDQLRISSPYNTYVNTGLPPGPIRVADFKSLDAVLDYEKHDYIYMCAKADLSGYHAFATNYADHLNNARMYQAELNRLKIMK
ncbi:Endolytic murein transglycosylase [Dyadobacter sp. CECT 9275]|uniref:Endolytic murein transglycosylase n=1 Tax=Dyadobacter helix TaxID=2822344 RepID=A0A916JAV1_9BACT|nr:endolytic transglycosylase MltG [Dyadobacter sp. CECT 9275]CAG4991830.1 Endolytic murein transglycosylase [Dyadobacter sp. CECT 9275]